MPNNEKTKSDSYSSAVCRIHGWQEGFAVVATLIGTIMFGRWGYYAGGIGGAILFALGGLTFGFQVGNNFPFLVITAIGTLTRLAITSFIIITILVLWYLLG